MCIAVKMQNFITMDSDNENILDEAKDEFNAEILETGFSGGNAKHSHGVFFLFKDCSAIGIFQNGMTLSSPEMVLHSVVTKSTEVYDAERGKVDRIRHDG